MLKNIFEAPLKAQLKYNVAHGVHWTCSVTAAVRLLSTPGLFCDGTRRYGVPAPFFQVNKKQLFVMYIVNE